MNRVFSFNPSSAPIMLVVWIEFLAQFWKSALSDADRITGYNFFRVPEDQAKGWL